jgi:uncharacterized protein involved in exopolysaccharide biosynthesis
LEIAIFAKPRKRCIIQVVDAAVPPDKKSSPHRTLIVIAVTILSFFVACFWVFVRESSVRAFERPENRQRLEAIKQRWKAKHDKL